MTSKGVPIVALGYLVAGSSLLSSLGHYFSHEVSEKLRNKATIIFSIIISMLLMLLATLTFGYVAAILYTACSIFYGVRNPVFAHLLNLEIPSNKRATILSISNLFTEVSIAIFAPIMGWIAQNYSINISFMIAALSMIFGVIIFSFIKDKR